MNSLRHGAIHRPWSDRPGSGDAAEPPTVPPAPAETDPAPAKKTKGPPLSRPIFPAHRACRRMK